MLVKGTLAALLGLVSSRHAARLPFLQESVWKEETGYMVFDEWTLQSFSFLSPVDVLAFFGDRWSVDPAWELWEVAQG